MSRNLAMKDSLFDYAFLFDHVHFPNRLPKRYDGITDQPSGRGERQMAAGDVGDKKSR